MIAPKGTMDILEKIEFREVYGEWVAVWSVRNNEGKIPKYRFSHSDQETFLSNLPNQRIQAKKHFRLFEKRSKSA